MSILFVSVPQGLEVKLFKEAPAMFKSTKSYAEKPQISFKDQEDGEVVFLLLRQHFATNLPWVLTAVLLFLIPIAFLMAPYREIFPFFEILPGPLFVFIFISWYQFLLGFVLVSFSGWFFNLELITNKRILDVDYWGFLYFNVSETPLGNIQDITYNISGLAQILLNYGNVYIQTAGTAANFEFRNVPNPAAVHDFVTDVMQGKNAQSE